MIHDRKRSDALDVIKNYITNRAQDAMTTYKKVVADTYFNEPVEPTEEQ